MTDTDVLNVITRLRVQHADLRQGAMYSNAEDPGWDATADAVGEIERLRAEVAFLRRWKAEATETLNQWEEVWNAARITDDLGGVKAWLVRDLLMQLRKSNGGEG